MDALNIIVWLLVGGIVGIVVIFMQQIESFRNRLAHLIAGIAGGFVGGVILYTLDIGRSLEVVDIYIPGALAAIVGSIILQFVVLQVLHTQRGTPHVT
ncbi:MAG: hypothetical protein D6737_17060 [Chloroflexi bacterium]|nr:MAG: hypothetical protein CUN54_08280 [Phototrophicales bacterium]RMF77664.1 MAG: hypothetical protein D6737_17060 [Chloroflexota bacterium]